MKINVSEMAAIWLAAAQKAYLKATPAAAGENGKRKSGGSGENENNEEKWRENNGVMAKINKMWRFSSGGVIRKEMKAANEMRLGRRIARLGSKIGGVTHQPRCGVAARRNEMMAAAWRNRRKWNGVKIERRRKHQKWRKMAASAAW
jgi:hypothetical protein